jgi:hypothetical protein
MCKFCNVSPIHYKCNQAYLTLFNLLLGAQVTRVRKRWYTDQDTRWTTGYFASIPGTGNRCFSFPVHSDRLWNFTVSCYPSILAVPQYQYVQFHQYYALSALGATLLLPHVWTYFGKKNLYILINIYLITPCNEMF